MLLLTETWTLPDLQSPDIPGYTCISSARAFKHARAFRGSGGIACYLRNAIADRFELWRVSLPGSILWLKSKDKFMQETGEHHLYVAIVYIPPKGSTFESQSDAPPAYDILRQDVTEIAASSGLAIVAGDFNARTASAPGVCHEDFTDVLDSSLQPDPQACMQLPSRQSADEHLCTYGKVLLELCEDSDLRILNGRMTGSTSGHLTCRPAKGGGSVVDYFLASPSLMPTISSFTVHELCAESDHCRLSVEVSLQASSSASANFCKQSSTDVLSIQKIRYDASKLDLYKSVLASILAKTFDVLQPQLCLATALQSCISQAALSTFGQPCKKSQHRIQQKWFDSECKAARDILRHTVADAPDFAAKLKAYKQLCRRKRRAWQRQAQQDLCDLASKKPQAFWRQYQERQRQKCDIPRDQWKASFEKLYKAPEAPATPTSPPSAIPVIPSQSATPSSPLPCSCPDLQASQDLLNADINHDEVKSALKRLKRNKAAGVDGIKAEFILDAHHILLEPLVQTFNQMLHKGVPPSWCVGLIHPIFKAGDADDPGNYRGITVVVILAKLYAMVLEARASAWAESTKARARGQAGFRKDFRTTDQIFIIQSLVNQAKHSKRKLYCCFVDFKKAFDLVPRDTLWSILEQRGMKGKVLTSLKSMYAADKACVLTPDGPTEMFDCSIGVKQGCPASPLLFSLYLDELEQLLENAHAEIDCPRLQSLLVAILLFADDIAMFSYSRRGLQRQLDILASFCSARGLTVNVQKTKTMVFEARKSCTPDFMYADQAIEQVDDFKYLGIMTHYTGGLTPAIEYLCKAAKRAMFGLQRRCQQLGIHDPILKCKLFDTLVRPILSYCCEVWSVLGCNTALAELERVQVGFLKVLLGVQVQTKTLHVMAEFGRYPLKLAWQSQATRYLERLEAMPTDRVLKHAFIADCRLPASVSWHAKLTTQLHDFLVPAPSQDNPEHRTFSLTAAQAAYTQQLHDDPSSKTLVYKDLKVGYSCEPYIQHSSNRHLRRILAQFRTGSHWLKIETGRHSQLRQEDRTCPVCPFHVEKPEGVPDSHFDSYDSDPEASDPIEDEHHAIFECSSYNYVRGLFPDLFPENVLSVGQFLNQPNCNRVAKFLTLIRYIRANLLQSNGPCQAPNRR